MDPLFQLRTALKFLGASWNAPSSWSLRGNIFNFRLSDEALAAVDPLAVRARMSSAPVRKILHNARDFLRTALFCAEAHRRPKDFAGLERGWNPRESVRSHTYACLLFSGGPSLLTGGFGPRLKWPIVALTTSESSLCVLAVAPPLRPWSIGFGSAQRTLLFGKF